MSNPGADAPSSDAAGGGSEPSPGKHEAPPQQTSHTEADGPTVIVPMPTAVMPMPSAGAPSHLTPPPSPPPAYAPPQGFGAHPAYAPLQDFGSPQDFGTPPPSNYGTPPDFVAPQPPGYAAPPVHALPPTFAPQPGYSTAPPPPSFAPPAGYGAPPPGYGAPPPGYGPPPPGYGPPPQPGYGAPPAYPVPGYPSPYGSPSGSLNALAIGSLIASIVGVLCGLGSIVGIALGFVALSQIKHRGERGQGFAVAGIIVGTLTLVGNILLVLNAPVLTGSV
jgi:hypothetical protein